MPIIPQPKTAAEMGIRTAGQFDSKSLMTVPEIATAVAMVIARFAEIDMLYEAIAVDLLGGEGMAAATVLSRMKSTHERSETVSRLLKATARNEDKALLAKINASIEPLRQIRNTFAHGIWGITSLKDSLLLTEGSDWNMTLGAIRQIQKATLDTGPINKLLFDLTTGENGSVLSEKDNQTISDIRQHIDKNQRLNRAMGHFFENGPSDQDHRTKIWTIETAWQAAEAAEAAVNSVVALQICMQRSPEEVAPLRDALQSQGLLPQSPHTYLGHRPA